MRRDVEVADQDMPLLAARMQRLARLHLVEELQLVFELRIERRIGNIAAGRHIEIVQHQRLVSCALSPKATEIWRESILSQNVRISELSNGSRENHRYAMIALLAVQRDMLIAEPLEAL